MQITTTAERYDRELRMWLDDRIAAKTTELVAGVPADVYLQRVAYLRALSDMRAALSDVMKKAKD